jgi:hypothetical protein
VYGCVQAGAVAGWMLSLVTVAWLSVNVGEVAQRLYVVAYGAAALGACVGGIAGLQVKEASGPLADCGVTRAMVARSAALGVIVSSSLVLLMWVRWGFDSPYLAIPVLGTAMGAWIVASRRRRRQRSGGSA